ncbi:MAG: hypothetical protein FH749_12725 [Firmicutes bacterium]|nr:hypothetical protein [Bacillota bacterium]
MFPEKRDGTWFLIGIFHAIILYALFLLAIATAASPAAALAGFIVMAVIFILYSLLTALLGFFYGRIIYAGSAGGSLVGMLFWWYLMSASSGWDQAGAQFSIVLLVPGLTLAGLAVSLLVQKVLPW